MKDQSTDPDKGCMSDFDPRSLPVDEARRRILESLTPVEGVERAAVRHALNRVLAEAVHSGINVPAHDNSAMDGYAVDSRQLPDTGERCTLRVAGTAWAGRPFDGTLGEGECARIMTGAVVPEGTDSVVVQEVVERDGDVIRFDHPGKPGQNVRSAGEDIAKGSVVLHPGKRLRPADLGLLASVGIGEVSVTRRPRVAFFSTGDELRAVGETLGPGEIYDSNRYTLWGLLTSMGVEALDMGVVRDTREATRRAFGDAAAAADVVLTSGGVSVGEADFVTETLEELGKVDFWKVAIKPGRPLAFGRLGKAWFFGLPGNPVSVMATFHLFVRPALYRLSGQADPTPLTLRVTCQSQLKKRAGRVEFQRGVLEPAEDGDYQVRKTGPQGSGILTSMSLANCFIVLPLESEGVRPGDIVTVMPFCELN
jgi:molybdopterin molybdotransferase